DRGARLLRRRRAGRGPPEGSPALSRVGVVERQPWKPSTPARIAGNEVIWAAAPRALTARLQGSPRPGAEHRVSHAQRYSARHHEGRYVPKQLKLVAAGVIAVMLAIPTGAFLYIHFVEPKAPARLSLSTDTTDGSATSATAAAAGGLSGTWKATPASQVGYRVNEVLFGQVNVAVGRTSDVSGTLTIGAGAVTAADLTVD